MSEHAETSDVAVACDLTVLNDRKAHEQVAAKVFEGYTALRELDDGYALQFPGFAWAEDLLRFISRERKCCPFFTFELVCEADDGPLWLHLRGSKQIKLFLEENTNLARN